MKKIIKRVLFGLLLFLLACIIAVILFVLISRSIHKRESKVTTEDGIQEKVVIDVNGIKEELSICGENQDNPVILFLHGGPGSPTGFLNYVWEPYIDNSFTMVSYDQRGCGKTYYMNQSAEVSRELIIEDIDATVDYVRERFGQDKIIIMGHSWGTLIGSVYASEHPEKVRCYIGVGQVVQTYAGEIIGVNEAVRLATEAGDDKYVTKITNAYKDFEKSHKIDNNFMTYRNMEPKYLIGDKEKMMSQLYFEAVTSPDFDFQYMKWFLCDSNKILTAADNPLTKDLFDFDAYETIDYQVPMYFISGSNDYVTPVKSVEEYCDAITAPDKKIIVLDGAGHNTFNDLPYEFSASVKNLYNRQ